MTGSATSVPPKAVQAVSFEQHSVWTSGIAIATYLAAIRMLLYAVFGGEYGIFRDELYYLACSEHLDWGYVDQPPLIALVTWFARHVFGESALGLRFLPALAAAATIILAAKVAKEFGGGRFAQVAAALAVVTSPILLTLSHILTMNAWEPLMWLACAWLVARIANTGDQKLWLWFGVLAGLGLQNKYSIGFFGAGIVVGLLFTSERRALIKPWIWIGGAIALAIFLPNLLWQINRDLPFLELMKNIRESGRDVALSPGQFFVQQAMIAGPLAAVIWIAGLIWFFRPSGKQYRVLGWAFLFVFVTMMVLHGKVYYVAPVYPIMFAAGGAALERWIAPLRAARWLAPAYALLIAVFGIVFLPFVIPVLPPQTYVEYSKAIGFRPPRTENQRNGPLENQLYADMFGWKEMAQETARAYQSLPEDVRGKTAIFVNGYGQGGAIDFFGPELGLPKSIGGHQNYWFWGPREYTGESIIVLGDSYEDLAPKCEQVEKVGRVEHPYSRRDEHFNLLWCRGLKWNLKEVWPNLKSWN